MLVDLLTHGSRQYPVTSRDYTQWVRSAEIAGTVRLRKGRHGQEFWLRVLSKAERPPVLKAYLELFHREIQCFFPVPAGSPVEAFGPLVPRYPAFELLPDTSGNSEVSGHKRSIAGQHGPGF
jgi:hypothetical protein